ncbi:MAG: hypothetical protein NT001_00370, partial [Candidatus Woesearchaeota archaeon]|nr:hypothetical protein [Candidatus Woesearchaeota archaeon]
MVQDFELKSVDVDNEDEVKPAEVLTISFSVVNTANETFENIQTDMWFEKSSSVKLHDNNDDIIRPSFDLNDIDAGDDKSVDYDLTIPWDVKNGERYEIIVRMKGRNSTSNMIQTFQETIGSFKIVKENTELYLNASFNPLRVTCGDDADLHIAVRDIGGNDESGVNLTAVNKVIGIEIRELFDM